jgi:hypothetical protein
VPGRACNEVNTRVDKSINVEIMAGPYTEINICQSRNHIVEAANTLHRENYARHICQAPSRARQASLISEPWPPEKHEVITLNAKAEVVESGNWKAKRKEIVVVH